MDDQYALISYDGRLIDYVEAVNVCAATDAFIETFGEIPDGAYVTNLTCLLEAI